MKKIILLSSIILSLTINIEKAYCKNETYESTIVISFKDETGEKLKNDITLKGYVNEEYQLDTYQINGYTLKNIIGNKSGVFLTNNTTITYIYEPLPKTNVSRPKHIFKIIIIIFLLTIKKQLT